MSPDELASARNEIATAVSSVEGVSCTPYFRQNSRTGDASVKLARLDPASNGFGMVAVFQVWIALPQDLTAAEKWIDDHHAAIADALRREWVLTAVTPAEFVIGTSSINGVIYEGTR